MKRNYIYNIYVCFKELFLKKSFEGTIIFFFEKINICIFVFLMKTNLITTGKYKSIANTYL